MGRRISNSKEQFYYSLIENERLKDMEIFNVLKEKYMDFYNVCEKFADISLNARSIGCLVLVMSKDIFNLKILKGQSVVQKHFC